MIYLASPYSHPDPEVREKRYKAACHATAYFMAKGHFIFSPIAMTHGVCLAGNAEEFEYQFWRKFDEHMIAIADEFWVLRIEGWEQSKGVAAETAFADSLGKLVRYV